MHLKLDFTQSTEKAKEPKKENGMNNNKIVVSNSKRVAMAKVMSVNLIREKWKRRRRNEKRISEETKPRCRQQDGMDCVNVTSERTFCRPSMK